MPIEVRSGLTTEMRNWLAELGIIGNAQANQDTDAHPAQAAEEDEDRASAPSARTAKDRPALGEQQDDHQVEKIGAGNRSNLVGGLIPPIPPLPDPPDVGIICRITATNQTDQVLKLDKASIKIESGKFSQDPPDVIDKNDEGDFRAVNKVPFTAGAVGQLEYVIDDQGTRWLIRWENARLDLPNEQNEAPTHVTGPNQDKFKVKGKAGPNKKDDFTYTLTPVGGPNPKPDPKPQPGPTPDVTASCQITINNNTQVPLKLAGEDNEKGDFMTQPATSLQPGGSTSFAYIETARPKDNEERGCKGALTWEVGSPAAATWRVEWDNPVGQKNTAKAAADPQSAGFESLAQEGQGDENVPFTFTLSGGGAGPGPGPKPGPQPDPDPPFDPPAAREREPTLRKGDKSKDGWVEYLQSLLNLKLNPSPKLDTDGDFGAATLRAVHAYQKQEKLQDDGTVGNQTWASLRDGAPEKPSTDGRQPHSFIDHGKKARWATEDEPVIYHKTNDTAQLVCASVGDVELEGAKVTVRVTPPGAKARTLAVTIGPPTGKTKTGEGDFHTAEIPKFMATFPSNPPGAKVEDYIVEAYFDGSLGGDSIKTNLFDNDK